jgi:hypothetical protein
MPPAGFKPTIPASKQPQTLALDCATSMTLYENQVAVLQANCFERRQSVHIVVLRVIIACMLVSNNISQKLSLFFF